MNAKEIQTEIVAYWNKWIKSYKHPCGKADARMHKRDMLEIFNRMAKESLEFENELQSYIGYLDTELSKSLTAEEAREIVKKIETDTDLIWKARSLDKDKVEYAKKHWKELSLKFNSVTGYDIKNFLIDFFKKKGRDITKPEEKKGVEL